MLSVRCSVKGTKGKTVKVSRRLQAKGETCTLQTGKLCYNAINIKRSCACVCTSLTSIYLNHNIVWQLLHRRPVLCLKSSSPSHFVHFQNWTPKIKPPRKLYPPPPHSPSSQILDPSWDVLNQINQINHFCGFPEKRLHLQAIYNKNILNSARSA